MEPAGKLDEVLADVSEAARHKPVLLILRVQPGLRAEHTIEIPDPNRWCRRVELELQYVSTVLLCFRYVVQNWCHLAVGVYSQPVREGNPVARGKRRRKLELGHLVPVRSEGGAPDGTVRQRFDGDHPGARVAVITGGRDVVIDSFVEGDQGPEYQHLRRDPAGKSYQQLGPVEEKPRSAGVEGVWCAAAGQVVLPAGTGAQLRDPLPEQERGLDGPPIEPFPYGPLVPAPTAGERVYPGCQGRLVRILAVNIETDLGAGPQFFLGDGVTALGYDVL